MSSLEKKDYSNNLYFCRRQMPSSQQGFNNSKRPQHWWCSSTSRWKADLRHLQHHKPVLSRCLLQVSHSWLGTVPNWRSQGGVSCAHVHESPQLHSKAPSGHHPTPDMTPPGICLFFKMKTQTDPNFLVIYQLAITRRACEASCYLCTAFIQALEQPLITVVRGWWRTGTATAGMRTPVWLQTSCMQNHAQQIKLN